MVLIGGSFRWCVQSVPVFDVLCFCYPSFCRALSPQLLFDPSRYVVRSPARIASYHSCYKFLSTFLATCWSTASILHSLCSTLCSTVTSRLGLLLSNLNLCLKVPHGTFLPLFLIPSAARRVNIISILLQYINEKI